MFCSHFDTNSAQIPWTFVDLVKCPHDLTSK